MWRSRCHACTRGASPDARFCPCCGRRRRRRRGLRGRIESGGDKLLETVLGDGERLVWAAHPVPRYFTAATVAPVLFAIPWTGFAIFWTVMAFIGTRQVSGDDPMATGFRYFFPLFGVPFILIGLAMFSAPYWAARRLKRTMYAITDRRAIILAPGWSGSRKVRSFTPAALASIERTERSDGSGDLIFEEYTQRRGSSTHTIRHGFISVPRVRDVEDVLRKTLVQAAARTV